MPNITLTLTDDQFELLLKLLTPQQITVNNPDILDTPLERANFSTMPQWMEHVFMRGQFKTLRELLPNEYQLKHLQGMGPIRAQKIKEWVESLGVKFESPRF